MGLQRVFGSGRARAGAALRWLYLNLMLPMASGAGRYRMESLKTLRKSGWPRVKILPIALNKKYDYVLGIIIGFTILI